MLQEILHLKRLRLLVVGPSSLRDCSIHRLHYFPFRLRQQRFRSLVMILDTVKYPRLSFAVLATHCCRQPPPRPPLTHAARGRRGGAATRKCGSSRAGWRSRARTAAPSLSGWPARASDPRPARASDPPVHTRPPLPIAPGNQTPTSLFLAREGPRRAASPTRPATTAVGVGCAHGPIRFDPRSLPEQALREA